LNDLDKIKQILFGNEKKRLDSLVRRLERPESRTADVADILPDAVTRSYNMDDRLGKALSSPLESTLSEAIRREPKKFADALYPVMGPAIRKAIAEAIKSTLQTINTAIEEKSVGNRYKAWRAGVPLAQYVFQKSVVYRVDEVYLVDPESGRLVSYLYHPDVDLKDEDAVSAMLTAIQDFVRDSFAHGTGGGLGSVVIDEYTVLVSQGPHAMLACVVQGVPPAELKVELDAANERVHLRHSQALDDFDGVAGSIKGLDIELENLLRVQRATPAEDKPLIGWKGKLVLFTVFAGFLYLLANAFLMNAKVEKLASLIRQTPGILTTEISRLGHRGVSVEGLQDPLAANPVELAAKVGIESDRLRTTFQSFQSLEPDIIEKRAVSILAPPENVVLQFSNGVLIAQGSASASYREQLATLGPMIGGVSVVNVSGLRLDDSALLEEVRRKLLPPDSVDLSVTHGVVVVSGVAPKKWHDILATTQSLVPGVSDVNSKALKLEERVTLVNLVAQLNGRTVYFNTGSELLPNQDAKISKAAAALREFERLSKVLNLDVSFRVVGEVDGTGNEALNESLMARRAGTFRDALISYGVSSSLLLIETSTIPTQDDADPKKRRAVLKMSSNN